ncbi:DNA-3-methyladenine glycosylase [Sediminitomix flava]|uniref:Methylpurine-DNA glycosylase (MPG) n=1 Tax=Sediminitomix flava TaxID=379075 RepID=A0A315ZID9_SEDFL|nr:DNA-3-methyladenine glycosylase [Sediminitomix flava]PWJ44870.1 methylpurine-DNA glycosylase (MPG) [Sediminitomix flava]
MEELSEYILAYFSKADKGESVQQFFEQIAEKLLNQILLSTPNHLFRMKEIEFYLHSAEHPDAATHCFKQQLAFRKWYFHRTQKGTGFRGGNYKGLDICFGDTDKEIYFGILIRAIEEVGQGGNELTYTYGPSKTVDRLLESTESSIPNLDGGDISTNDTLSLISHDLKPLQIFACPRKGLPKSTPQEYQNSYYRFFIDPKKQHAEKEKRIIPSWLATGYLEKEEILKVFGRKNLPKNSK